MRARQRPIGAIPIDHGVAGHWSITAYPRGKAPRELTTFRGIPTKVESFSFADPFGAQEMALTFPASTVFDARGYGDLDWATKFTDVDMRWVGEVPEGYDATALVPGMSWEGYIVRFSPTDAGLGVQLKGAGLQLDNYLAKPEFLARPLPYEWAIARCFLNKPALRLHPLRIIWPEWWTKTYVPPVKVNSSFIPAGVSEGEFWTGLLTRQTGSWNPSLTGYIAELLAAMYSERGRWTIDFDVNRQPVMFHRDFVVGPGPGVVTINPRDPGVKLTLTEDWEQSLTTVFIQGKSRAGVAYTGMQVSSDGQSTFYRPAAALRQVYPDLMDNDWFDHEVMPREVMLATQTGLSADDAALVARAHLSRFSEPGQQGTVTLKVDPTMDGAVIPRHLVRAGMDIHLPYVGGRPEGVVAHVSASSASMASEEVSLTIDTKARDALTVQEVMQRGRDSLQVSRMLVAGHWTNPISDLLMPWSYAEGSGFIPSNDSFNALPLFEGMPNEVQFPWDSWIAARPPKDPKWRSCYIGLGPTQANANSNWFTQRNGEGVDKGSPVKMGALGSIRLTQIAAYDANGHVLKVPFHVGFYAVGGVNVDSMPLIPVEQVSLFPPYAAGQHYPFVRDGFEKTNIDGTATNPKVPHPTDSVGMIRVYGNFYEKAGFWPGSYAEGDEATGLLVDETSWDWDTTGVSASYYDPLSLESNLTNVLAGQIYVMFYCDEQLDQEVFFLGRLFRLEPQGSEGG
jgi:hypothetical protein